MVKSLEERNGKLQERADSAESEARILREQTLRARAREKRLAEECAKLRAELEGKGSRCETPPGFEKYLERVYPARSEEAGKKVEVGSM